MAKNTKQIALIQHRRGQLSELPTQLNEGEFGLSLNTNQLFIGNPENDYLSKRIAEGIFPYGNIEVLTEFTDNMQKIKYTYKSNTDIEAKLPIIIIGKTIEPYLDADSSILINGTEIFFEELSDLDKIIETINKTTDSENQPLTVKAYKANDSQLGLISTSTELLLADGRWFQVGNLEKLGITTDSFYSETSDGLPSRTLQETLDDTLSIKAFGVKGSGEIDDSVGIYNAIVATYKTGDKPQYYRQIMFPAGTYKISEKPIALPSGCYLVGEGIGRTIIKTKDFGGALLVSMDDNMTTIGATSFSKNSNQIKYVSIENMTFDVSDTSTTTLLSIGSTYSIHFKNVEFIGDPEQTVFANIVNGSNHPLTKNATFENCYFVNGVKGIEVGSNCEHLIIKNCHFENIKTEAIVLNNSVNTIIDGNTFKNCGFNTNTKYIITLGDTTYFTNTVNNSFDKEVFDNNYQTVYPYISYNNTNYTDIWDKKTDTRKIFKYNFAQPSWEYIDYLLNPNGEYLIKADYGTESNTDSQTQSLTNGLIIRQGDAFNENMLSLHSSLNHGDINISGGGYSNINIGKDDSSSFYPEFDINTTYNSGDYVQDTMGTNPVVYMCIKTTSNNQLTDERYWKEIGEYTPKIVLHKNLDLNESKIQNKGSSNNITLEVDDKGIVLIEDTNADGTNEYSKKISSMLNAVPTVQYVNKAANSTVNKIINYQTILNTPSNKLDLVYFDPETYGDVINLDRLSINIRRPFYPINQLISTAPEWTRNMRYYIGDVVKNTPDNCYLVCLEDHFATEEELNYVHWNVVLQEGQDITGKELTSIPDIKYISIIATNKIDNPMRMLFARNEVDISRRDIKAKYYPSWTVNTKYKKDDMVQLDNKYYKCVNDHTSVSSNDVHDINKWTCPREEGFNYIYDFDREMTALDINTESILDTIPTQNEVIDPDTNTGYIVDPVTIYNFSGYYLYVEFLDENMNLIPVMNYPNILDMENFSEEIHMQASPAGYMNIKLKYVRGDNYED